MVFVEYIYIIVLPIRQVIPKKDIWKVLFFGPHLVQLVANLHKCNALKP